MPAYYLEALTVALGIVLLMAETFSSAKSKAWVGIAAMASIGLPGLANFSGEVLVFLSAFRNYDATTGLGPVQIACILSIWGVVISVVYMLRAYRKIFQGPSVKLTATAPDLTFADKIPVVLLVIALLAVGLYSNLLLNLLK